MNWSMNQSIFFSIEPLFLLNCNCSLSLISSPEDDSNALLSLFSIDVFLSFRSSSSSSPKRLSLFDFNYLARSFFNLSTFLGGQMTTFAIVLKGYSRNKATTRALIYTANITEKNTNIMFL